MPATEPQKLRTKGSAGIVIEVQAEPTVLCRGETVEGRVLLLGGRDPRHVNEVVIALQEHYLVSTGETTSTHFKSFQELRPGREFELRPGQGFEYDFSFQIPRVGRITTVRNTEGWSVFTRAGISWAKDPSCRQFLHVGPEPPIQSLLEVLLEFGFTPISTVARSEMVHLNVRPPERWSQYLDGIKLDCLAEGDHVRISADVNWQEQALADYLKAVVHADHTKHDLILSAEEPGPALERFFSELRLPA